MRTVRNKTAVTELSRSVRGGVRDRMLEQVSAVVALFEQRWTLTALRLFDGDLCAAVLDQLAMFHEALASGSELDVVEHGEAMVRGWQAAIVAMERSRIAEDAVHIGQFGDTRVAIGRQQTAPAWVRERWGDGIAWLTPRECAVLYCKLGVARELKRVWPGGELVDVREKDDG